MARNISKILSIAAAIVAVITLVSCGESSKLTKKTADMFYMDTIISTRFYGSSAVTDADFDEINKACGEIIKTAESALSRTIADSQISEINQSGNGSLEIDATVREVIAAAFDVSTGTGGAYDPTLGALTDLWDIVGKIKSGTSDIPSDGEIAETLTHTGIDKFRINESAIEKFDADAKIDLGGIGKGYAAQMVSDYLNTTELRYGLVSMGGNVGVFGSKPSGEPFKIAIADPDDGDSVVGYILITSGFVSVSGDYERYIEVGDERYHHIFDPATGYPSDGGLRSVAVHCDNGMYADALSTALFVMGMDKGMEFYRNGAYDFEAVFIADSGEITVTDGLRDSGTFTAVTRTK